MWSEKYKPRKLAMMVGNEASRLRFYRWLKDWKPKTKPVMLIGSPGTGKTTIVHLVAEELGYTLVELNASDFRSKSVLEGKLGPVMTNTTLMDVKLLIFFDEADGIESREDYGAVDFITELLQKVKHPIVMAANAGDASAVEKLAKKSEVIQFARVSARSLELYARRILDQEEIEKNPAVLSEAVSKSRGDVRAMINNLQEISTSKTPHTLTSRDEYLSIQETITRLSQAKSLQEATEVLRISSEHDTREKLRAVYYALITSQVESDKLAPVLEALSQLDLMTYKCEVKGSYKLRQYFDILLAKAIFDVRRNLNYHRYATDTLPFNLRLRFWNDSRIVKKITERMSKIYNYSSREASSYLPYIESIYGRNTVFASEINRTFDLDESSANFMVKEAKNLHKHEAKATQDA